MIKTIKVMLCPNNKQATKLKECAGVARFVYNWALWYQETNYDFGYSFASDKDLRKVLTRLKASNSRFSWLNTYSNDIAKQAVKDLCSAYKNFFEKRAKYPKFKSRKRTKPSFYVDPIKIQFTATHVKLEKLTISRKSNKQKFNWVRLAEHNRVPIGAKYSNPRITFDGLHWWLSVGIDYADSQQTLSRQGIGIDLGIKSLAVCSNGITYANINKTSKVKKLKKRQRRLQRQVSKKYLKNKKGGRYCKTHNIIKSEKELLKVNQRITNIRYNYLHQVTSDIVNRKPRFIVLEDLNVSGMLKNKHLSKAVQEQCFYKFYRQIEYKSRYNNIEFIVADRFYPSSKLCSCCGSIKKDLKLSDRIYHCTECGLTIDRDFQASVNLMRYGLSA